MIPSCCLPESVVSSPRYLLARNILSLLNLTLSYKVGSYRFFETRVLLEFVTLLLLIIVASLVKVTTWCFLSAALEFWLANNTFMDFCCWGDNSPSFITCLSPDRWLLSIKSYFCIIPMLGNFNRSAFSALKLNSAAYCCLWPGSSVCRGGFGRCWEMYCSYLIRL